MLKRLIALAAVLFFCSFSHAATTGGTCPTGANYVNVANEGQSGTMQVTLASLGVTSCYYVGTAGKDSNAGTSESVPFLHIPDTPNFTGSATLGAGVGVIIQGGYVAHLGNSGLSTSTGGRMTVSQSGSSSAPLYIGIDSTWYSGSSFARPVLSGDNPIPSGTFPSSCTYDNSSLGELINNEGSYVIYDGLEFSGACWSSNTLNTIYTTNKLTHVYLERLYQHGWSTPSSTTDSYYLIWDGGAGTNDNDILALSVVDGSDASWAASGSSNCHWGGSFPGSPCYSGGAVYEGVNIVWGNVLRHLSNAAVTTNNSKWHDNYVTDLAVTYQLDGQHTNCNNEVANVSGSNDYFYNNVTTSIRATECYYLSTSAGNSVYGFNNVFWGDMNYYESSAPSNCVILNATTSGGGQSLYWYNNTMDAAGGSGGGCMIQLSTENSPLLAFSGSVYFGNTDAIGYSQISNLYEIVSGASANISDGGNEVYQTESAANSQGYTTTDNYAPTSASGATHQAGKNLASFCSEIPDSHAAAACANGTTGAVAEASGWGGEVANFPAISLNARGSSWDAGAYQFGTGPGSPSNLGGSVVPN